MHLRETGLGAPVGPVELALGELCEDVCHVLILRGVSAYRARTQTPLINPDRHAVVVRKVADHPCINGLCNEFSSFVPSLS